VIVRQPDGTAAHIPEWMIRPEAKQLGLWSHPRLSLNCLRELRELVGAILRTLACKGDSDDGGTHVIAKNPTDSMPGKPVPPTRTMPGVAKTYSRERGSVAAAPASGGHTGDRRHRRKRGA